MKTGKHDLKMPDYLALKALSAGVCHELITSSPAHARYRQDNPGDASEASDVGTAIHDALLEGVNRIVPIDAPDWRTKAAKEKREETRTAGGIPLLAHKANQVLAAVDAAKAFVAASELAGIFDQGEPERTMIWIDGGVYCKARPDWLPAIEPYIVHVKTTQGSAEPEAWIRNHLVTDGYDISAAFYERGMGGRSVFLVIEQSPPYGCSWIGLAPELQDLATRKVERAIGIWHKCSKVNVWPAYPSRICYAEPKPWQLAEQEQRELHDFDLGGQA